MSVPSNFFTAVNTTVLAGMFNPMAKVSVANKHLIKDSPKRISINSFNTGSKPLW